MLLISAYWTATSIIGFVLLTRMAKKSRSIIDFALLSLYFKGVDVIAYFHIKILISTKVYKTHYLFSSEAILQQPTQLYTIIHFFLIQHSE